MARFTPGQIQEWTSGQILRNNTSLKQEDRFYRGISTDTRTIRPGEIFLAFHGPKFDGHDFLDIAIAKKAACLIVEKNNPHTAALLARFMSDPTTPDIIMVDDTLEAYQEIAHSYRNTLLCSVIAITGSVSKTTTRRMVATIMSASEQIHETEENKNNQIGLPLTLLQADDDDSCIIAEMGMDHRGEIGKLSLIARPDIAIITNIGYSHAQQLESRENILQEKTDIVKGLAPNGTVILNGQDPFLQQWALAHKDQYSILLCSNEKLEDPELAGFDQAWAEDLQVDEERTSFTFHNSMDIEHVYSVVIPEPGKYLVRAAVIGLTCAYIQGNDMALSAKACSKFRNTGNRNRLIHFEELLVIDDSYNASPESVEAALDNLKRLGQGRRKVICLAGMKELGKYCEEMHRKLADSILDLESAYLLLVGEETLYLQDELAHRPQTESSPQVFHFSNSKEAAEKCKALLQPQDAVLVKGSRAYQMETITSELIKPTEQNELTEGIGQVVGTGKPGIPGSVIPSDPAGATPQTEKGE